MKKRLWLHGKRKLPISTLRGAHVDNREWLDDPAAPAIIVGTVDMIGSRLLFEGYGVSRKMRPYQAGLLGVDALIVLDEAHLVPPFAHLLRAIEQNAALRANDEARPDAPAALRVPAALGDAARLRAKTRRGHAPFRLEEEDWKADHVAKMRLEAKKRVRFEPLAEKDQDRQFAEAAWELATKDGKFFRVVVFCDRRDKKDDWRRPERARRSRSDRETLPTATRKRGAPRLRFIRSNCWSARGASTSGTKLSRVCAHLGFIGQKGRLEMPAFLVATSAGEVGVDIDADHMVSDLVAWERMVQRLGRVNRRGEGDAEIKVFWSEPSVKDANAPTESEKRALIAFASKAVVESLPQIDDARDASPGALRQLAESARSDRR